MLRNEYMLDSRIIMNTDDCITLMISSLYPDDIIKQIKELNNTNVSCLILESHDVWRYNNDKSLMNFLSKLEYTVIIAHNGYEHSKPADNVYSVAFLDSTIIESCLENKKNNTHTIKTSSTEYGFSSLNNRYAYHRLLLGRALYDNNLLNQVIYSQNTYGDPIFGYEREMFLKLNNAQNYLNQLPILVDTPLITSGPFANDLPDMTNNNIAYINAFCNIVTESETEFFGYDETYPTPTISEKTFKPFNSFQIPIFLASQGHMNYLNKLGFYTFDDLFSIAFDNANTFQKIDEIINLVSKGKEYIKDYYFEHINEIKHNHIKSNDIDSIILKINNDIKGFITNN